MIKISISKLVNENIKKIIEGKEYTFKPVPVTTRNNTLNKLIEKKVLYGKVLYNPDPIHQFKSGDIVVIKDTIPARSKYIIGKGFDCSLSEWNGHDQNMCKTDVQLLECKEISNAESYNQVS